MNDVNPQFYRENWPFFWISQVNAAYIGVLERRIKPLGIDIPRWRAMMSLYQDQHLSVSEIAEFSAQKLNTTTKVVQRMVADELVSTRARPSDGRVTEVCLTEKGEHLRALAMKEAGDVYKSVFGDHAATDITGLNAELSRICASLREL